ncbi:hypothetical protein XCR_3208 [Xanthomonas campestris pv. raphani 756C]|nr:hypothetical protein XCR_3208 [Xanthomonas campestris pv. raphani 756C]
MRVAVANVTASRCWEHGPRATTRRAARAWAWLLARCNWMAWMARQWPWTAQRVCQIRARPETDSQPHDHFAESAGFAPITGADTHLQPTGHFFATHLDSVTGRGLRPLVHSLVQSSSTGDVENPINAVRAARLACRCRCVQGGLMRCAACRAARCDGGAWRQQPSTAGSKRVECTPRLSPSDWRAATQQRAGRRRASVRRPLM